MTKNEPYHSWSPRAPRREVLVRVANEEIMSALLANGSRGGLMTLVHWEGIPADAVARAIHWSEPCRCWEICLSHPSFKPLYSFEAAPYVEAKVTVVEVEEPTIRQHTLIMALRSEVEDLARKLAEAKARVKELESYP